jgi:hypothetical protein
MCGEGRIELQWKDISSPWFIAGLVRIARDVVAGMALVGFGGGIPLRLDALPQAWRHVRGAFRAKA